jgi:salicylate hydroxylase
VQNDHEYTVHIWWADSSPDVSEGWDLQLPSGILDDKQIDPRSVIRNWSDMSLTGFIFRVQRLISRAKTFSRAIFKDRSPLRDWVDESERVVLIGEAAHPLMVRLNSGPMHGKY